MNDPPLNKAEFKAEYLCSEFFINLPRYFLTNSG